MENSVSAINKPQFQTRRAKKSEYGKQLAEKQELKKIYGIREGHLKKYVDKARRLAGNTSDNMLILLERRLDNVIYQLGFAETRPQARQYASHGLFILNNQKVDIPSILIKDGDVIRPRKPEQFKDKQINKRVDWVDLDTKTLVGTVKRMPVREQIDVPINENLVIQFYSR